MSIGHLKLVQCSKYYSEEVICIYIIFYLCHAYSILMGLAYVLCLWHLLRGPIGSLSVM